MPYVRFEAYVSGMPHIPRHTLVENARFRNVTGWVCTNATVLVRASIHGTFAKTEYQSSQK